MDILSEWEKEWSLEFHPDKCKVLRVTNKLNQIRCDYHIHGHTLNTVDCAKYLGVTINKKLSWQPHVDAICKKANQTRAFLQRNLKICYPEIKEQCYKTYVRPQSCLGSRGRWEQPLATSTRNGSAAGSSICL